MAISMAKTPMRVIIIGAGIAGLSSAITLALRGHDVIIFEGASKLLPLGAGIKMSPNMLRLLDRWGVGERIRAKAVRTLSMLNLRWQNGSVLAEAPIDQSHGEQLAIHRADLHDALWSRAQEISNIQIHLRSTVVDVVFDPPQIHLADGQRWEADVLLAADGIKSKTRPKLLGDDSDTAVPTGDALFRVKLEREDMEGHPDLIAALEGNTARRWIGPDRHVVGYPVRNHQVFNIEMAHPDRGNTDESWTAMTSKSVLLKEFDGWDPFLLKALHLVPGDQVLVWQLCWHLPLKTWIRGRCALLGDACHAMVPYLAQGAAQAVEDAGALGILLSSISNKNEVPLALELYEQVRKARAEDIQLRGRNTGNDLHLPDGPEQESRDARMADPKLLNTDGDVWVDAKARAMFWHFDVEAVAQKAWEDQKGNLLDARLWTRL